MMRARKASSAASASPHRRSMIAKVHIAQAQLGLSDDDYRAVMLRVAGRTSAAECSDGELEKLLAEFAAKGFRATSRPNGPRPADHPQARKARALWISLHHLGAIDSADERALEAFARRQLGCDRLQWANQAQVYKLVEALKAIATRHGWDQSVEGLKRGSVTTILKRRLVEAIVDKLHAAGIVPASWSIERTAFELAGAEQKPLMFQSVEEVDRLAKALGAKLRAARDRGAA
jgi:phage gp16-like protein